MKTEDKKQLKGLLLYSITAFFLVISIALVQFENLVEVFYWIKRSILTFSICYITVFWLLYVLKDILGGTISTIIIGITGIVIAVVNEYKLMYRGAPFFPVDISLIGEVGSIADGLRFKITGGMVLAIALFSFSIIVMFIFSRRIKDEIITDKKGQWKLILIKGGLFILFFWSIFINDKSIPGSSFAPEMDYYNKGVIVGFLSNLKTLFPPDCEDYNEEIIKSICKDYVSQVSRTDVKPNILVIMSESMWDIETLPNVKYSEEIFPNMNKIRAEAISGSLLTSVYGGGTSTTEFEVLTGFNNRYLPLEITPYYHLDRVVNNDCFSIASYLKKNGYHTVSLHTHNGVNYNRVNIYPRLGFDKFIARDDFSNPETVRSFISDKEMVRRMISEYESHKQISKEPLFLFAVSVQNHGGYSEEVWTKDMLIDVKAENLSPNALGELKDLATGLKMSDEAFGNLVDYFKGNEEPTIIIQFGDHVSKVGDSPYEIFEDTGAYSDISEDYEKQRIEYSTPFVVWSNYEDIDADLGSISSAQLLPAVFELYGLKQPLWFGFLNDVNEILPGLTMSVVAHKDGTYSSEMTKEEREIFQKYKFLQYDYLYEEQYGINLFD